MNSQPSLKSPSLNPHPILSEYHRSDAQRRHTLSGQFDQVAPDYDWISQMLSFGSGNWYREHALRLAGIKESNKVLDVACGPGTLSICAKKLVGETGLVIGLDPSIGMLNVCHQKGVTQTVRGIAEALPFREGYFDFVVMGYALRHVSDLNHTFQEYWRVLKQGGKIVILEISKPDSVLSFHLSRFFLKWVVPRLSYLRTRNPQAHILMRYYWETIQHCVSPGTIIQALRDSGFSHCQEQALVGGLIRDYIAQKRESPATLA